MGRRGARASVAALVLGATLAGGGCDGPSAPTSSEPTPSRSSATEPTSPTGRSLLNEVAPDVAARAVGAPLRGAGSADLTPPGRQAGGVRQEWVFVCRGGAAMSLVLAGRVIHRVPCDEVPSSGQIVTASTHETLSIRAPRSVTWQAVALQPAP